MASAWCRDCGTCHPAWEPCPEALDANEPERHAWRVNVETAKGVEAFGVLVARAGGRWRARILTYPNVLWLAPGTEATLKFVASTPAEAQAQAIGFIRSHCGEREYRIRPETAAVLGSARDRAVRADLGGGPAPRKIRFLPLLFGPFQPSERGGTGNLSETGLFVITVHPIPDGRPVAMRLALGEAGTIPLDGRVVWMRKDHAVGGAPGMGIRLLAPPAAYLDYVRSLEA